MTNIDTVIFDLDGTLLPMDTGAFMSAYNIALSDYVKDIVNPETFVKAVWQSTKMTIENLEYKKNYDVFKEAMAEHIEGDLACYFQRIYQFYDDGFLKLKTTTHQSSEMIEAVNILKNKGYRLLIATNPLFPMKANHHRIGWAGLSPSDFEYISCFEENHYCKPHLAFYEEVLALNTLVPSQTLMVGNDVVEDLAARQLGLKTYLIEDYMLRAKDNAFETDYQGTYKSFLEFVKSLESK